MTENNESLAEVYLYDNYAYMYYELGQSKKELFFSRCVNVESILKIENEVLPKESFQNENEEIPDDKIKLKLQKEIGKYVLSSIQEYNIMNNEEIAKIFQFEVEVLLSLKELINSNHYDILMLEDILFISRMLDQSINLDTTMIRSNVEDLVKFMENAQDNNPGPKMSNEEISEYVNELIANFKTHTELMIKSEFLERNNSAKTVIASLYSQDSENYQKASKGAISADITLKAIYENALGYNQIYGIPLRVLKNVLLMINVNLLKANLQHGISSSEESNLFSSL